MSVCVFGGGKGREVNHWWLSRLRGQSLAGLCRIRPDTRRDDGDDNEEDDGEDEGDVDSDEDKENVSARACTCVCLRLWVYVFWRTYICLTPCSYFAWLEAKSRVP